MSDDGMDACECIWNHELAMRRLLSLLRQGQAYCTNSECLEELPGLPAPAQSSGNDFIMLSLVIFFGVMMFLLRPRREEMRTFLVEKNFDDQGPSGPSPPPPPAAN